MARKVFTDTEEIWKSIESFPGYEISNEGRLRRWMGRGYRTLNPYRIGNGYREFSFWKENKRYCRKIHRLVLEAFVENCPGGYQTNHKDGNKENNYVENLEWVTPSDNINHDYEKGLKSNVGIKNPRAKLKDGEVWLIKKLLYQRIKSKIICLMFKIGSDHLYNISTRKIWNHIKYTVERL